MMQSRKTLRCAACTSMKRQEYIAHIDKIVQMLTDEELGKYVNGAGSDVPLIRCLELPMRYEILFENAIRFHDVAYWAGGTREHQKWADEEFYKRARFASGTSLLARAWAWVSWRVVKAFGQITFEGLVRPRSLLEMKQLAKNLPNVRILVSKNVERRPRRSCVYKWHVQRRDRKKGV